MASRVPASLSNRTLHLTSYDIATAAFAPALAILTGGVNDSLTSDLSGLTYWAFAFFLTIPLLVYFGIGAEFREYCATSEARNFLMASVGSVVLTTAIVFLFDRLEEISRAIPFLHCSYLFFGFYTSRILLHRRKIGGKVSLSWAEAEVRNVLLVGTGDLAWSFIQMVNSLPDPPQKIVGILDTCQGTRGRTLGGYTVVGRHDLIGNALDEFRVHGVIVNRVVVADTAIDPNSEAWTILAEVCSARNVEIEFLPDRLNVNTSLPKCGERAFQEPAPLMTPSGVYWKAKRIVDVAASIVMLLLLAPLIALVACLVLFSVGRPVLFWQERLGQHGRTICVHKFRSMLNPIGRNGQILNMDERQTRVGRFLRATRLDELPQLFDILVGDMSFIGPRPLLPHDQPADSRRRLSVRPGLTGWAQVNGGQLISAEQKCVLDHWYIENACLRLDIKILILTAICVVLGDRGHTTYPAKRQVFRA